MAMRLPGGVRSASDFWSLLYNGLDARGPVPADRYNAAAFDASLGGAGAIPCASGYFIDSDLSTLDTSFFSIGKTELEKADPQQRQLLEVTRECLESAGEVDYRGKAIGCYVGTFGEDWLYSAAKETLASGGYTMTGHVDLMIANRVSYEYDLQGPSMVVKTGCSASLVALHEAFRALQSGDCSGALVAGTSLIMGPTTTAAMFAEGILSPEASCKTFDASADGFARAEAITCVYVKLLEDAVRDGNPIRAVIRNTGSNSDGKSVGLMAPNGKAHEALMRKVYEEAELKPVETGYVECHGTGTATGDPIETNAVGNVFGEHGVYIGSVKPNIGHSEGSSGISSLIKSVLILEHKIIPPNIKFNRPNPKIPFAEKKLTVPTKPTPWPTDRKERISINSFGIGGANAHLILDAYNTPSVTDDAAEVEGPQLLLYSANTQASLQRQIENITTYHDAHSTHSTTDLAYTLGLRREHLLHRAFAVVPRRGRGSTPLGSPSAAVKAPAASLNKLVMVFSGQGAQWAGMGADLIQRDVAWRDDIRSMDSVLNSLIHPPEWSIEEELLKTPERSLVSRAEIAQPLCTALQIAQVNSLARCGVRPAAVVGHSSGEIAAAYATGALSMAEAITIAYYRGLVTKKQTLRGAMAAIGLSVAEVQEYLQEGVIVACENSPSSITISGDEDKVSAVVDTIKKDNANVLARLLKVDMAYHSHHMRSLAEEYRELMDAEIVEKGWEKQMPLLPMFSTVHGGIINTSKQLGPTYWTNNLLMPVKFHTAIETIQETLSSTLFVEIGPHATLAGPLRQICAGVGRPCIYISTMVRGASSQESFLSAIGQLYQQSVPLNLESIIPHGKVLHDMPTYAWDHSGSYWHESRVSKDWRFRTYPNHVLLGVKIPESTSMAPVFRNVLNLEHVPWLADHKVRSDIVFPFAGYCCMAGEAVRQIMGMDQGYALRHVRALSALVLAENKSVEIVTTLRRQQLTDSTDSEWFEFTITHYAGAAWVTNCRGQVRALMRATEAPVKAPVALPRKVKAARLYDALSRSGIVYGPEFRNLEDISASPTDKIAVSSVRPRDDHHTAPFLFHPATMDSCFQLFIAAIARGAGRNLNRTAVPTCIEEIEVHHTADDMTCRAWCLDDERDIGIDCTSNGTCLLRVRGMELTGLGDEEEKPFMLGAGELDHNAAARLEWLPDFDFADVSKTFKTLPSMPAEVRLQEEMTFLCVLDSAERVKGLEACNWHFDKFREWLDVEIARAHNGTYPVLAPEHVNELMRLSRTDRDARIRELFAQLSSISSKWAVSTGTLRVWEKVELIFTGQANTLDTLMEGNVLTKIYDAVSIGHGEFVRLLSNTKPNLRILEVGAGTGGTTEMILRDLTASGGEAAYANYTFTDISAGFFTQATERFSYAPNMEYKVFDISKNPFDQGFTAASYDLILAPNVVHATSNLNKTLKNLEPLLKADGRLVLTELCAVLRTPNYIFGNFDGWWLSEDNRPWEPYIDVNRWDVELKAAGFSGVDTAVFDAPLPERYCAAIISRPARKAVVPNANHITVVCNEPESGISNSIISSFEQAHYKVDVVRLGDALPEKQDVICTLDLEAPFFDQITASQLTAFQAFNAHQQTGGQKVLWLMPPTQVRCKNPRGAQTIGLARTIRAEMGLAFFTLEIDVEEPNFSELVRNVTSKVQRSDDVDQNLDPDREFAVDQGIIKIGRYHPFSLEKELSVRKEKDTTDVAKKLSIGKPGLLDTFGWTSEARPASIGPDEVEIEAKAIGLNFKDVILAMGIISAGPGDDIPLGLETAGCIIRVGSNVLNLTIGDRVIALSPGGCAATSTILPAAVCAKIPAKLSFEDAATLPICYATAYQSLVKVGQLEDGQTVLIHSAAGGVGHAAVNIARMLGAEIFATVGSDEKVEYLSTTLGIPRDHIFHSRDDSFYPGIMKATNGRGVDVVLNSLSGELLHATWQCVAEFGKLVELGKRDAVGAAKLDMRPFLANRSYCCVDLSHLTKDKPNQAGALLRNMLALYQNGWVKPIAPTAVFDAENAAAAFRHLQNGDHIGKAVLRIPGDISKLATTSQKSATPLQLDGSAAYLLTGGLGGLGKSIATWMAERGARSLIFLSRSAGTTPADEDLLEDLKAMSCNVSYVQGEVQDCATVERAIAAADGRPIRGILHLAMVLRDVAFSKMTIEEWTAAVSPKVDGVWNLHQALEEQPLDFFFLASSLNTVVVNPGQSSYCAANTFLEAFVQFRRGQGKPATVLNIAPVDDVGYVADNEHAYKNMKAQGISSLGEQAFLRFLELALLDPVNAGPEDDQNPGHAPGWKTQDQIVMCLRSEMDLDDPNNPTTWRRDRRMGTYHNMRSNAAGDVGTSSLSSSVLKTFLSKAAMQPEILQDEASVVFLAQQIGRKALDFMLRGLDEGEEVDVSMSLEQIGLDSLMAIELRRWWKQAFGLEVSVLEIMGSGVLAGLGKVATERLFTKFT
ncbi:KR domain-containing protein, partial [Ophiobolus disseminans]